MKVVSIENAGNADKVYDLHIENYHNFATGNGIMVKNSGVHNVPVGDAKCLYKSRFPGGCVMMPDGSQMEIRMLAANANEKALFKAFKDGLDIHRFFACFTGDTKIKLLDGTSKTFKELVDNKITDTWVYSLDDNDRLVPGHATNISVTKTVNELVEIELDSGDIFRCTSEHLWRTRNGYIMAKDLSVGTSISPLYLKYDRGYEMFYDLHDSRFEYTHIRVTEEAYGNVSFSGMVRHHIDYNKSNNRPDNLKLMTWKDHTKLHQDNCSQLYRWTKSEEHRELARKWGVKKENNPDFVRKRNKAAAITGREFLRKDGAFRTSDKYAEARKKSVDAINRFRTTDRFKEIQSANAHNMIKVRGENWRKNASAHMSAVANNPATHAKGQITKFKKFYSLNNGSDICIERIPKLVKNIGIYAEYKDIPESTVYHDLIPECIEFLIRNGVNIETVNHKVVSVRIVKLDHSIEVYDMEVDKYHNFALACNNGSGVFVHNSKIYNVEYDKVEKWQRGLAKNAVFGLVYGMSEKSFADAYTHGDIEAARKIFDDMYSGFPGIKDYIKRKHEEYMKHGKVTTITQRFMDLDATAAGHHGLEDKNAQLRRAQNAPIQGCFTGDTLVKLSDGTLMKISELHNLSDDQMYCYAYDKNRRRIVPARFINPHKTKEVTELVLLILDNGRSVKCTPDHKIMLKTGEYIEAKDLKPNDSIMPWKESDEYDSHLCEFNRKVVSVNTIKLDVPVPVYDITVPKYNNFVIGFSDMSGIVVHNSAEDLAGIIMYQLIKWMEENNMKSKPFCFIHDSIEIDAHPDEVFKLVDKINYMFNVYPIETFGVPVACDVPLGPTMGQEIIVEHMDHDEEFNDVTLVLEGIIDDIEQLLDIWRGVYDVVEYVDKEEYEKDDGKSFLSYKEMFLSKKAKISKYQGVSRASGKRKIHVVRKVGV